MSRLQKTTKRLELLSVKETKHDGNTVRQIIGRETREEAKNKQEDLKPKEVTRPIPLRKPLEKQ